MSVKRQKLDDDGQCHVLVILPVTLLATVLGARDYWRNAHKLVRICKAFKDAVYHPNFWMPAVRAHLQRHAPVALHPLIDYVNPFFRFPAHVANCPNWPWWTFLQWLFPKSGASITFKGNTIYLHSREWRESFSFEERVDEEGVGRHTRWLMNSSGSSMIPAICVTKHDGIPSQQGTVYYVTVDDKYVWYDGPLASNKHWCGNVKEITENLVLPMKNQGFYRE